MRSSIACSGGHTNATDECGPSLGSQLLNTRGKSGYVLALGFVSIWLLVPLHSRSASSRPFRLHRAEDATLVAHDFLMLGYRDFLMLGYRAAPMRFDLADDEVSASESC